MTISSSVKTVLFYIVAGLLVSVVPILAIQRLNHKGAPSSDIPFPTSLPRKVDLSTGTVVYHTSNETTTTYWTYGHIASWDTIEPGAVNATFVFDKDPNKTRLPIKIMGEEGRYYLRAYSPKFADDFKLMFANVDELKASVFDGSPMIELRVAFLRENASSFDQQVMKGLEAANSGKWNDLPTSTLQVESIGIEKAL